MRKYGKNWESMRKCSKCWESRRKCVKTSESWESMLNAEKVLKSVLKVEKMCHRLIKYGKTWESMRKCAKSWESLRKYRRPSLFMGITFQENTANTKTANTKSNNNNLKTGVPFLIFADKCEKTYTKTQILTNKFTFYLKNVRRSIKRWNFETKIDILDEKCKKIYYIT